MASPFQRSKIFVKFAGRNGSGRLCLRKRTDCEAEVKPRILILEIRFRKLILS